jgi:predicted CXXCH cytochrome family protein
MRSKFQKLRRFVCIAALALLAGVLLAAGSSLAQTSPSPAAKPPAPAPSAAAPAAGSQDVCLACHGPYENLIEKTAKYYMPSGETTSPHKYLPHKSKNIPDCKNCHKPHALPPPPKQSIAEPSTDWCYTCHHKGVLECGTCH